MKNKVHETAISYIRLIDNRIVRVELKEDVAVSSKEMLNNLSVYRELLAGKKGLFLTIIAPFGTLEDGLKTTYEAKQRIDLKEAEAFVVPNLSSRIEVDYLTVGMPQFYPRKLFKVEKEAMGWLKEFY